MKKWALQKIGFFGHKRGTCDRCQQEDVPLHKVWTFVGNYPYSFDARLCEACGNELVDKKNRQERQAMLDIFNT